MNVLSLSDQVVPFAYSPRIRKRFQDVDFVIGCGDLPYFYLEYVLDSLNVPLFFVRGNHDKVVEYGESGNQRTAPSGGVDLHKRIVFHKGLLIAGVEGCLQYRPGRYQYTQFQMWQYVIQLVPGLIMNRFRHGRFLDIFVTHAPPAGIHDASDLPHQGIDAFRWLLRVFRPAYHFHGHVHLYRPDTVAETLFGRTLVINTFGWRETELKLSGKAVRSKH